MVSNLPEPLNTDKVSTRYDERNQILIIEYHNELTAESTEQMYTWCLGAIQKVGLDLVRGVVYDFTGVTRFTRSNLMATRKGSLDLNAQADLSAIPVALVAKTLLQEQHLSIGIGTTLDEERKRIVRSISQGIQFIKEFHRKQEAQKKNTSTSDKGIAQSGGE